MEAASKKRKPPGKPLLNLPPPCLPHPHPHYLALSPSPKSTPRSSTPHKPPSLRLSNSHNHNHTQSPIDRLNHQHQLSRSHPQPHSKHTFRRSRIRSNQTSTCSQTACTKLSSIARRRRESRTECSAQRVRDWKSGSAKSSKELAQRESVSATCFAVLLECWGIDDRRSSLPGRNVSKLVHAMLALRE